MGRKSVEVEGVSSYPIFSDPRSPEMSFEMIQSFQWSWILLRWRFLTSSTSFEADLPPPLPLPLLVPQDISLPETSTKIVAAALTLSDRIDVLISNAGICPFAPFLTMPLATYKITQAVNMGGHVSLFSLIMTYTDLKNLPLRRNLLHHPGCRKPDGDAKSPWRIHHRHLVHQCARRRRKPDSLHTYKVRGQHFHMILFLS